jgi:hypothetical protein
MLVAERVSLILASCQGRASLEPFYADLASSNPESYEAVASGMLRLLPFLHELCRSVDVWALTSHATLVLLSTDDWHSRWHVRIRAVSPKQYRIWYFMPEVDAPWPDAAVEGIADSPEQAVEFIRIAMQRSGGWSSF